jgi:predicted permease
MLSKLRTTKQALLQRSKIEHELDDELRDHLSRQTEQNIRLGMSPEEACAAARIAFGGIEQAKERSRDVRGFRWMEDLRQDLSYGARMLLRNPGFTLVAVVTLALGIGANTAIFSVIYTVMIKPLPFHEPERLVMVWTKLEKVGVEQTWVSEPEALDFREQAKLFEGFGLLNGASFTLTGAGEPEQLIGAEVTANFLSILGAKVLAGRDFLPGDELPEPGPTSTAILSHSFWQRRFGGERSVIGRTIYLSGKASTVVGVLPPNFTMMLPSETQEATNIDVWVPYIWDSKRHTRHHHTLTVIGRMKPGVRIEQAQEEMKTIAGRLSPLHYTRTGFAVKIVSLHEDLIKKQRPALLTLFISVGFVLLIACANVANLLLSRAGTREKEIAVRAAMGAGPLRLARQLLTESVLLALCGGSLGALLAIWGVTALHALRPADLPRLEEVGVNLQILAFTGAISILTGILFGLLPALRAAKPDLMHAFKDSSRNMTGGARWQRLRGAFVVTEIALSLTLLIGAGLVMRSFLWLIRVDPGFDAGNVLTAKMSPPRTKYKDGVAAANLYQQLIEKIQAIPGVEAAAAIQDLPLNNDASSGALTFEGVAANAERANLASFIVDQSAITPDYFRVMKTPLLAGRFFTLQDARGKPPVAIIDETLARRLWPTESPIGRRLTYGRFPEKVEEWATIVGVVRRVRHRQLDADIREKVYFPHAQSSKIQMTLVIRANSDPLGMVSAVRAAAQSVDHDLPIYRIRTMDEVMSNALAPARFTLLLLMIFAGVAATLAIVGIYGVISYTVTQRTHEIGVRLSLGARPQDVLQLIIRQGAKLTLLGVAIGLAAALSLTRLMHSILLGVSPTDPATYVVISLALMTIAILACWIPARRAAKVDPVIALR